MSEGNEPEVIEIAELDSPNLHPVTETVVSQTSDAPAAAPAEKSATQSAHTGAMPPGATDPSGKPRKDRNGRTFDPSLHATHPNGDAVVRTDGRLMLRPDARRKAPGAASGGASRLPPSATAVPPAPGADASTPVDAPPPVNYRDVARSIVVPTLGAATLILGPDEWSFGKVESDQYIDVTEQLCRKYGIDGEFPPELQLGMLGLTSVAARASKPKTAAWLGRVKAWGVGLLVKMGWLRQPSPPAEPEKPEAPQPTASETESASQ